MPPKKQKKNNAQQRGGSIDSTAQQPGKGSNFKPQPKPLDTSTSASTAPPTPPLTAPVNGHTDVQESPGVGLTNHHLPINDIDEPFRSNSIDSIREPANASSSEVLPLPSIIQPPLADIPEPVTIQQEPPTPAHSIPIPASPIQNRAPPSPQSSRSLASHADPNPNPSGIPVTDLLNHMRDTIVTLGKTFETLQDQHEKVADVTASTESVAKQVHDIRKQLVKMDTDQERNLNEVKEMIQKTLIPQIADSLRVHLRDMVRDAVGMKIKDRVATSLSTQFPNGLEEALAAHRKQLSNVRQSLQNAEVRRSNGLIKANQLSEPLLPILREDGTPSPNMPADLTSLFTLPDKPLQALFQDYGLYYDPQAPRERMYNRIMQFLGLAFQMVPSPPAKGQAATPLLTRS